MKGQSNRPRHNSHAIDPRGSIPVPTRDLEAAASEKEVQA